MDEYSIALGKLLKWILFAVELRIEDVMKRRDHKTKLREERDLLIEAANERERLRTEALEAAI